MEIHTGAHVICIDLQLRSCRECRRRQLAVHPEAFAVVGRRYRGRGHERRVELCRHIRPDLAFTLKLELVFKVNEWRGSETAPMRCVNLFLQPASGPISVSVRFARRDYSTEGKAANALKVRKTTQASCPMPSII